MILCLFPLNCIIIVAKTIRYKILEWNAKKDNQIKTVDNKYERVVRIIKKHIKYIMVFVILLIIEIFIGIFMHQGFIREYVGDMLVIPLLYAFIRIFWAEDSKATRLYLPLGLFLFGVCVELLQAIDLLGILEIRRNSILGIIIGSTCDVKDILSYLAGAVLISGWNYKNLLK